MGSEKNLSRLAMVNSTRNGYIVPIWLVSALMRKITTAKLYCTLHLSSNDKQSSYLDRRPFTLLLIYLGLHVTLVNIPWPSLDEPKAAVENSYDRPSSAQNNWLHTYISHANLKNGIIESYSIVRVSNIISKGKPHLTYPDFCPGDFHQK